MKSLFVSALLLISLPLRAEVVAIEGARVIDGTGHAPMENATIIVDGDHIAAIGTKLKIPAGARVIDAHGRTIIPGLISAHSHVGLVANGKNSADAYTRDNVQAALLQYEKFGVTSICSLGLNRDLVYDIRDEQHKGTFPGASLFTAGRGIGAPDGAPPVPVASDQVYRPTTLEEAVADVRETASHHPDMLKIWVDDVYGKFPKMKPEVYKAAIDEAHKNNIRVASHLFYLADAKSLANDGVDVFAHSIRDQPVDAELIDLMKKKNIFYVSTLTVDESSFVFAENPSMMKDPFFAAAMAPEVIAKLSSDEYQKKVASDPNTPKNKAALATGMQNLKALHDAGVHIAFGTDSGAQPVRIPGWAEHHELSLMVRAGLTPMDALVAATRGSAALLNLTDRGVLKKGMRADFIVLAANPLDDINNTKQMVAVWHGGKEVQPPVPAPVDTVRLYAMDCGRADFGDMGFFSDTGEYDGKPGSVVDTCFLIQHPKGTLIWDTGFGDKLAASPGGVDMGPGMHLTVAKTLEGQLQSIGIKPADITYLAFSHMHPDHTGNANLFPASTWILNSKELAWATATPSPVAPDTFSDYKTAKTQMIDGDYDIFGDGSVKILRSPGHTPGHQNLIIKLKKSGYVVLSGDLYHMRENRKKGRMPVFNVSRADTLASMARIEKIVANKKARFVIQHDAEDFKALPAFPAFLE